MTQAEAADEARDVLLALLRWYWTPLHPWMNEREVRALRDAVWKEVQSLEDYFL